VEILKIEKLGINFGGLEAVKDIDFFVKEGEIVGLIGPNGSGKTTFFNLITGIYQPTSGNIFLIVKISMVCLLMRLLKEA
jgi:branched-chain amino acid transport system ATP-binding protein